MSLFVISANDCSFDLLSLFDDDDDNELLGKILHDSDTHMKEKSKVNSNKNEQVVVKEVKNIMGFPLGMSVFLCFIVGYSCC